MKNPKKAELVRAFLARQKKHAREDGKHPAAHERGERAGKGKKDPS